MRTTAMTVLGGVVVLAALAGPAVGADVVNRIVATIDGEPVTLVELQKYEERSRYRPPEAGGPVEGRAALDQLVLDRIMQKEIESQGLTATNRQIDAYVESIRQRNNLTMEELESALAQQGMTLEQYREEVVRADIERANLIKKEVSARVTVSPEEIERYYEAHRAEFAQAPRVHVRVISLFFPPDADDETRAAVRSEAARVQALAADGKNFAKLAREHSQDPTAEDGGDLGELERGAMQDELDEAAFALEEGAVSDVIETSAGCHILKVESRHDDDHQPLDEVSDSIRDKLYREALESRYDRLLREDLRERHHVEILL